MIRSVLSRVLVDPALWMLILELVSVASEQARVAQWLDKPIACS